MAKPIDRTELFKKYPGRWVALAEDDTTVIASGATAREARDAALQRTRAQHFLLRVPEKIELFLGYAI